MVIKKIIYKISIYKVLPPYKNWYSIMTNDGLNRSNVCLLYTSPSPRDCS